jgi:hypothetical protein
MVRIWQVLREEDGSRIKTWVSPLTATVQIDRADADVYYDYLDQEILNQSEQWTNKVLLIRPTIAYLIRHARRPSLARIIADRRFDGYHHRSSSQPWQRCLRVPKQL